MKKKVYIADDTIVSKDIAERIFDSEKYELYFSMSKTEEDLIANCKDANALIVTDCDVTKSS